MSLSPVRGDRPRIAHLQKTRREHRQGAPDLSPTRKRSSEPGYNDASEWPEWTDEDVLVCAVPAAEWPAWTDRVAFAPVPPAATLFDINPDHDGPDGENS